MIKNISTSQLPKELHVTTLQDPESGVCITEASSADGVPLYVSTYNFVSDKQQMKEIENCFKAIEALGYKYTGISSMFSK